MIWQAICTCGAKSRPYVATRSMNADLYVNECLQNRLLPLIHQHDCAVVFWPDLASCHYATSTLNWYLQNNVSVVTKDQNPPNCPEFRPIARYWAIVKRLLKKNEGTAYDNKSLLQKWNYHAGKVSEGSVRTPMSSINGYVRKYLRS